jgi:hypothetical protein
MPALSPKGFEDLGPFADFLAVSSRGALPVSHLLKY